MFSRWISSRTCTAHHQCVPGPLYELAGGAHLAAGALLALNARRADVAAAAELALLRDVPILLHRILQLPKQTLGHRVKIQTALTRNCTDVPCFSSSLPAATLTVCSACSHDFPLRDDPPKCPAPIACSQSWNRMLDFVLEELSRLWMLSFEER